MPDLQPGVDELNLYSGMVPSCLRPLRGTH